MPIYDFECSQGHQYEAFLKLADYKKPTHCPTCKKRGKKVVSLRQSEPTFLDKLYVNGWWDQSVNKIFHSHQERERWLKKNNYYVKDEGHMTPTQERRAYALRVGQFNPRDARYANRD